MRHTKFQTVEASGSEDDASFKYISYYSLCFKSRTTWDGGILDPETSI